MIFTPSTTYSNKYILQIQLRRAQKASYGCASLFSRDNNVVRYCAGAAFNSAEQNEANEALLSGVKYSIAKQAMVMKYVEQSIYQRSTVPVQCYYTRYAPIAEKQRQQSQPAVMRKKPPYHLNNAPTVVAEVGCPVQENNEDDIIGAALLGYDTLIYGRDKLKYLTGHKTFSDIYTYSLKAGQKHNSRKHVLSAHIYAYVILSPEEKPY